jgi:hypothetical protein
MPTPILCKEIYLQTIYKLQVKVIIDGAICMSTHVKMGQFIDLPKTKILALRSLFLATPHIMITVELMAQENWRNRADRPIKIKKREKREKRFSKYTSPCSIIRHVLNT